MPTIPNNVDLLRPFAWALSNLQLLSFVSHSPCTVWYQHCFSLKDLVLRLNGPTIKSAGRVEVQHAGVWGTVAVRTSTSGDVVCRQQGYTGFLHIVTHLRERGVGPSWIQNLACTGAEKRITDCRYQPLNSMITYQPNSYTYLICNDTQNANGNVSSINLPIIFRISCF